MNHRDPPERCFRTTSAFAHAMGGLHRMRLACGADYDQHFVNALGARLPTLAEQCRPRRVMPRPSRVYVGALERVPCRRLAPIARLARRMVPLPPLPIIPCPGPPSR